jgi:outer membrane protein assembly factor BamB
VTRGTTTCCSALALTAALALAKTLEPLALVPVRPVWTLALNSHVVVPPAYDATHAFYAVENNLLAAYDVASGKQLWLVEARPLFEPVVAHEQLILAEAETLVALKVADGSQSWRLALEEPLAARPTAANGSIVAVSKSGAVLALRAIDGEMMWRHDVGSAARAPAAVAGGRVYVSAADGRVIALAIDDGEPVWERRIGGAPSDLLPADDRLFVGSTDNFFYCLLTRDGQIDWRWRTGGDIVGTPAADSHTVYFASLDNVVRALNQKSGGQRWMRALVVRPTSGPQLAGTTVVIAGQSPTIRAFNAKDGTPAVDIAAGDDVIVAPRVLAQPVTGLPMLAVVTRNIVRADTVTLSVRSIDPIPTPIAPLPTPITLAPTLATRP